ncbi:thiamine pyrophosphokinase [Clostridia bacterium]|nr:thiamine pyrophosphokinase [Clostridia bacterium]
MPDCAKPGRTKQDRGTAPPYRFVIIPGSLEGGPVEPVASWLPGGVGEGDYVCCADGGYARCLAEGIRPDIVIGDFDSEDPGAVRAAGIAVETYPADKDETDTLLCVKYGLASGYTRFTIVGGLGGEFSHTMANLQTLSFLTDLECEAEIVTARERLFMADGEAVRVGFEPKPEAPAVFRGRPGAKFSVFSYAERSSGVVIQNAKYELEDAVLTQSYPIGARNEFVNEKDVTASVHFGRLLIVAER